MSIATTFRALLLGLHDAEGGALLGLDDAGAVTALAGLHAVGVCGALAMAVLTGFDPLDGNVLLTAECGLFKGQAQHFPQVGALHGGIAVVTAATKAAEATTAKDGGEDVAEIEAAKAAAEATGAEVGVSTSYASLTSLNLLAASSSPGFISG